MENRIEKISTTKEKYDLYKSNIDRYNKAKEEGYNYECLVILNNLVEDVVSIILVHLGILSSSNRRKVAKKYKSSLEEILKKEKKELSLSSLGKKLDCLQKLLEWSKTQSLVCDSDARQNEYQNTLMKACNKVLEYEEIEETIQYLKDEWLPSRNEVTHALLFRDKEDVDQKLERILEEGYKEFRYLDKVSKAVKSFKIPYRYSIQ